MTRTVLVVEDAELCRDTLEVALLREKLGLNQKEDLDE